MALIPHLGHTCTGTVCTGSIVTALDVVIIPGVNNYDLGIGLRRRYSIQLQFGPQKYQFPPRPYRYWIVACTPHLYTTRTLAFTPIQCTSIHTCTRQIQLYIYSRAVTRAYFAKNKTRNTGIQQQQKQTNKINVKINSMHTYHGTTTTTVQPVQLQIAQRVSLLQLGLQCRSVQAMWCFRKRFPNDSPPTSRHAHLQAQELKYNNLL